MNNSPKHTTALYDLFSDTILNTKI